MKTWRYYSVFLAAVFFLSQCFAGWRALSASPSPGAMLHLLAAILFFVLAMVYLSFVNYRMERAKGGIKQPIPFFERWLSNSEKQHG